MRRRVHALTAVITCAAFAGRAAAETPEGTVTVTFTSASKTTPLQIGAYDGYIVTATHHGKAAATQDQCQLLCETTPCTLQLPPGPFQVCAGRGELHQVADLTVPPMGVDVQLRVPSDALVAWYNYSLGAAILLAIAGGVTLANWGWAKSVNFPGADTSTSSPTFVAGATLLGISGALVAAAIPVLVLDREGVASMRPHEAATPSAKLILAPAGAGVQGTF